jgi:orotate phosphoribosyltransferase
MADLISLLRNANIYKEGDFTLTSGAKTNFYVNLKEALCNPLILRTIANSLVVKLVDTKIDKLIGLELAAIPIITAVSIKSGIPMIIVRKESKGYGTESQIEGVLNKGEHVAIIDDVCVDGFSLNKTIDIIEELDCIVSRLFVVVDREQLAYKNMLERGYTLESLVKVSDLR